MSFWTYPDERYYFGWYQNRRDEGQLRVANLAA